MESPQPRGGHGDRRSRSGDFLAFLLVGGTAAVGYVAISSVLIALRTGVADWIVSSACYAAMVVPVYLAHRRLSFRSDAAHQVALPRYIIVQVTGLALAAICSFFAFDVLALPAVPASALVIIVVSGVNFLLLRLWAFRT